VRSFGADRRWRFGPCALAALVMAIMTLSTGIGWGADPIKVGFVSIFSGRVAALGETGFKGAQMAANEVNAQGGVLGRKIELLKRDSAGKIEEAVRIARDYVVKEKVNFLMDHSSSRESFAVKEVSRDLKILTVVTASETTATTADPKIWTKYSFRASRCGIHDAVGAGLYMAELSKKLGIKKWGSVSPDYEYGRDSTETAFWALKQFNPDVKVVSQTWPKMFAPDYTTNITALLKDKPDAIYSALWGGDLVSFIEQAKMYGLFQQSKFFAINLGDFTVLEAVKGLPEGLYSGSRCHLAAPATEANKKFFEDYKRQYKELPTNWSQECYTGMRLLLEGIKKAGTVDTEAVIKAMEGLTMKLPWGVPPAGTVTMRARDHTVIDYATGWGHTVSKFPFVVDMKLAPWETILKYEEIWLKEKGWFK
jgi:branched-chain amino acid transport system substrate-binding protein